MKVYWKGAATSEVDYSYHDDGYILLAPCIPYVKEVPVTYERGKTKIFSDGAFKKHMKGQYICCGGGWREILNVVSADEIDVLWSPASDGTDSAVIATLNKITVTKGSGVTLSKLEIDYTGRVR